MFEKEAEERARKLEESQTLGVYDNDEDLARDIAWDEGKVAGYEEGFKDGAEFGYNKACEEYKNPQLTKAKEIIKEMLSILPKENIEGVYEITEEAEQFIREVEQ